jgi:ribonucleoside-diphosphate reductase alpha chain
MLQRLGICSTVYRERREAGQSLLPDGKGGQRHYPTLAQHELVISGDSIALFAERIGFADTAKAARLRRALAGYRRELNRERFTVTVESVTADGEAEVFDASVPGVNAFDANGLYVHNCGEQPLPPYGACLLGSINLARLVREPFADGARLDEEELASLVPVAVRMLDNAIDASNFPLPAQAEEARAKRRVGLGVTGLADALIMVGARYGSARAIALTETWMRALQRAAYLASVELAREKGPFPLYDRDKYLAGETVGRLDEDVRAAIARHGIRNALLTSVAPTGTISLLADNVSSGLEPVFSFNYTRNILMPDGSRREEEVSDYAYRLYRRLKGDQAPLTEAFVDAQTLTPADHVRMQAAVQKYVDSSISKTINVPEDISFDDFKGIYQLAYDLDCKGCTTYRPNVVTGAVLEAKKEKPAQAELPLAAPAAKARDAFEAGGVIYMTRPLDRPEALPGRTYKVHWPESEHAIYITVNDIIQDGRRRPFEVFINSKNMEHYAWTVALTRMISAVFRRGGDVSFVVDELKAVFDPRGGQWMGGRYVPSLLAAIGEVIEQHLIDIGFIADSRREAEAARQRKAVGDAHAGAELRFRQCPKCAQASLINQEGCDICTSCGYSKCA